MVIEFLTLMISKNLRLGDRRPKPLVNQDGRKKSVRVVNSSDFENRLSFISTVTGKRHMAEFQAKVPLGAIKGT